VTTITRLVPQTAAGADRDPKVKAAWKVEANDRQRRLGHAGTLRHPRRDHRVERAGVQ
jgi:hypothetical protein